MAAPLDHAGAKNRSLWRSHVRRDQLLACAIGVVLLACSAVTSSWLAAFRRDRDLVREDPESERTLRSLAVSFPRLTLGGMRGIVSTYLWYKAEDDKNERRWLDLETKYDIIGALQPYFASVYIYHSWNQAYNLSAQWQEQEIKYKWVLDGLAYLYKGEEFNPGNSDIYLEEGHLYFLKLGNAAERIYYREHWRHDLSRMHELNGVTIVSNDDTVALRHVRDIIRRTDTRDKSNYLHIEELPDPEGRFGGKGWGISISDPVIDPASGFNLFKGRLDGKKPTEPVEFRYGVSPYYFAYIEYKRCLAASNSPTYTGVQVVDAWPAMSLRLWCRDDLYLTYDTMNKLFGSNPVPAMLVPEALNPKIAEIHDCYRNIQMIAPRAIDLFNDHLARYKKDTPVHTKHILETEAYIEISKAELQLFDTLVQWHLNGRKLTPPIVAGFQKADDLYKGAYPLAMKWINTMFPFIEGEPPAADRPDFERYANALQTRSRGIEALLTLPANQQPDMSFLQDEVVER